MTDTIPKNQKFRIQLTFMMQIKIKITLLFTRSKDISHL